MGSLYKKSEKENVLSIDLLWISFTNIIDMSARREEVWHVVGEALKRRRFDEELIDVRLNVDDTLDAIVRTSQGKRRTLKYDVADYRGSLEIVLRSAMDMPEEITKISAPTKSGKKLKTEQRR